MRHKIAAALLLFFCGVVLVCAGTSFACYALYAAFVPYVGTAAAAGIAAAVLLLMAVFGLAVFAYRAKYRKTEWKKLLETQAAKPPQTDDITLAFLAGLARDKPIIAVALAGLFGAATTLFRKK